jgi:hypothetical protein
LERPADVLHSLEDRRLSVLRLIFLFCSDLQVGVDDDAGSAPAFAWRRQVLSCWRRRASCLWISLSIHWKVVSAMDRAWRTRPASIILGGTDLIQPRAHGEPVVDSNPGRIIAMAKLARAFPDARIVYSGGDASPFHNRLSEADFVYPLLDSLGVPRERVLLESRSRNTAENAAFTKDLLKPKPDQRWLLLPRHRTCRVPSAVSAGSNFQSRHIHSTALDEKLDWRCASKPRGSPD